MTAFKVHTFFLNDLLCVAAFTRKERCIKKEICRPFFYSPCESYVRQTELKFCVSNCHICARTKPSLPEGVIDISDWMISFNFGQSLLPLSTYRTGDCVVLTHFQRSNPSHYAFLPPFSSSFQTQAVGAHFAQSRLTCFIAKIIWLVTELLVTSPGYIIQIIEPSSHMIPYLVFALFVSKLCMYNKRKNQVG